MMKTIQIGMGWFPEKAGGLNRIYYDCTRYLPQVNVQMYGLVAGSTGVSQASGGHVHSFAPSHAPLWQRWRGVRQAVHRILAEDEYPLAISHFALYTFPVLDQLGQRPLVMHFHGPWALESSVEGSSTIATWLRKILEQRTYRRSDYFIVLSEAFRKVLHQEYQVSLEQIYVIPGGVDIERFDTTLPPTEARTKLGWSQNRPIILAVRRLARRMGLENLIMAADEVRKYNPEVLFLIAGKGSLDSTLQVQIEELGLAEHVQLIGYVPEQQLGLAYRAADISIVPSLSLEGFGLTVVESLAAGTPVLGTPVGGIPEILRPLSEDLVLEGNTDKQLAQGILEALSGQRQLPSKKACETYIQENYAWPVIAKKIKSVYQTALR